MYYPLSHELHKFLYEIVHKCWDTCFYIYLYFLNYFTKMRSLRDDLANDEVKNISIVVERSRV